MAGGFHEGPRKQSRTANNSFAQTNKKHKTEKHMKTKILTSLVGTTLALAVAFAVWSPTNTSAQVKGATLLRPQPAALAPASVAPAMACAKCTTQYTSSVDTTARGAIKPVAIT